MSDSMINGGSVSISVILVSPCYNSSCQEIFIIKVFEYFNILNNITSQSNN